MPTAIAAAVAKAVAAFSIKKFLTTLAVNVFLSFVTNKMFGPKRPRGGIGFSGVQVTTRGALEYRKIVYGQALVSGPVVYSNTSGDNNENLWHLIALAGHESDSFVSVWLDGDEIPVADIDWTAGTGGADGSGTGDVSTSAWVGESSTTAVKVFYYTGHADQVVAGSLNTAFSDWGTNNRLRGVTYVVFQTIYDKNTEKIWEHGIPRNFKALIKGRKIYDPRLDSTNGGSGSHRYDTESTWEWSDNPALCVADYLISYMSVDPATDINWQSVTDAADDCEATVAIPTSSTEQRFTCNGAISVGQSHRDILNHLLSSMDGKLSYSGGQWALRASVWESSSVSIDENDLAGPVDIRGSSPRNERFNTVRGFYVDPERKYELVEFQHTSRATYVSRDNGESLAIDISLPFTNSEYMAQRVAYRNLEQSENQIVARLTLNAVGAKIAVGDVVSVTFTELSWSAKTFRVIEWQRQPNGTYAVTLREDESASYDDPIEADYTTKTASGGVTLPATVVPGPTGLTATSIGSGIRLTWTNPANDLFRWIDIYESTTSAWSGVTLVGSVQTDTMDLNYDSGTTRYFWIRARYHAGQESARFPDSDTSTITATSGSGADGVSVYVANVYKRSASAPSTPTVDDGSYDFDTNTLTPPTGWSAAPTAGSNPLYVSTGSFSVVGSSGTDSTVTWTSPDLLVQDGADGATGSDGSDGLSVHVANVYKRSASAPSTPTVNDGSYNFTSKTLTPPTGWSASPPAGSNPLYVSTGSFSIVGSTGTDSTVTWTSPDLLVQDGADSITSHLTNEAHVVDADSDGTNYSLTEAGGTHKVFDDTTDVTTSATHSVSGTATKNGLTMAVVSGTGVYSLSGASWTSDLETFTLRAVYGGKTMDKEYTIAKAKDGAGIGTITVSGATISDNDSVVARAGVRVNNDGTIDRNVGGTYTQISASTDWIIPNAHPGLTYHARLTVSSGDGPTAGSSINVWHSTNDSPNWYIENTANDIQNGTWLIEISGDGGETVEDSGSYTVTADNT